MQEQRINVIQTNYENQCFLQLTFLKVRELFVVANHSNEVMMN